MWLSPPPTTATTPIPPSARCAAIAYANANGGTITFNLDSATDPNYDPGTGSFTIQPTSALPDIDAGVSIDGTSQPGFAGMPIIVVNGDLAGSSYIAGLVLSGNNSSIRGLIVNGFSGDGIDIAGTNDFIVGNWIGLDETGGGADANGATGIGVGGSSDVIGGTTAADRNVISGNYASGIFIGSANNVVEGNYIGVDATGTVVIPNDVNPNTHTYTGQGVFIYGSGATDNTIGGTASGAGNIIAGNADSGVGISGYASDNIVEGNWIGTNPGGDHLGNSGGVIVAYGASGNVIGGIAAGDANTIAFNNGPGVGVAFSFNSTDYPVGNSIRGNSIHDNNGAGIDLGYDGPTPNDSEGHTGPNLFQDYPAVTSAQIDASGDLLVSFPNPTDPYSYTPVTVDFYLADASGQGMTYLGSNTTAGGTVSLGIAANIGVSLGDSIVATATDAHGNTSEFSPAVTVTAASSPLVVTNTNDSGAGSLRRQSPTPTATAAARSPSPSRLLIQAMTAPHSRSNRCPPCRM